MAFATIAWTTDDVQLVAEGDDFNIVRINLDIDVATLRQQPQNVRGVNAGLRTQASTLLWQAANQ